MAEEKSSTTGNMEKAAEGSGKDSSKNGLAFVLYTIKLHETAEAHDFERHMIKEIFPIVNTQKSEFGEMTPDQHFLLDGSNDGEYIWMIRMEYFIHHTPRPNWLLVRAEEGYAGVKEKVEPFGTLASTSIHYDVERWLRRVGFG